MYTPSLISVSQTNVCRLARSCNYLSQPSSHEESVKLDTRVSRLPLETRFGIESLPNACDPTVRKFVQ